MTIYEIHWKNNFQDVKINDRPKRLNFEVCYVEEKYFTTDFEAGKYVGNIPNQGILFVDKTKAYTAMAAENARIYKKLLTELRSKE